MSRRNGPTEPQRRLLDDIERTLLGIRYPVDLPDTLHVQAHQALLEAGLNVIREVPLEPGSRARRVDLVVVHRLATVCVELEDNGIPPRTAEKLRMLPAEVLRVVVLRARATRMLKARNVDRVVTLAADLRPIAWLNSGSAILEERAEAPRLPDVATALSRAGEASEVRRMLLATGERKGPKSAPSPAQVIVDTARGRR